ncbi:MAG: ergothioneine biosynthesis protein EgtB [Telluria sp.]
MHAPLVPEPLQRHYYSVRRRSALLAEPLSDEDCLPQSMPDASPIKWHLAHTTWFFETFILEHREAGFRPFHPAFRVLFNSYYNGIGAKHPRAQRGLVTRPGMAEVRAYRADVDARMGRVLQQQPGDAALAALVTLGLQHEQQHQELMLTDVKHLLAQNPLYPAYVDRRTVVPAQAGTLYPVFVNSKPDVPAQARTHTETAGSAQHGFPLSRERRYLGQWMPFAGGLADIGFEGEGFCFDNELPRHRVFVAPFELATRLVTNGEYLAFISAGGYRDPSLWLSEGWDMVCAQALAHPLYWQVEAGGRWHEFTLHGLQPLDAALPATHLSLYEADAYARWAGARLPTEAEWELAAAGVAPECGWLHPAAVVARGEGLRQMYGHCWQWTTSSYAPYRGFAPQPGALGEYNGKFMINQYVLRGSSCATPQGHARASYRNFFPAGARWQFSGIRLAR